MPAPDSAQAAFGERLAETFATIGQLCLNVDPHASVLDRWSLPDSAEGARELGLRAVGAAAGTIGIVKPQVAFFERHGAAGYVALERVLAEARDAGLLVIADAKRGDIGTTVDAYGEAWLRPGSPLESDAMTVVAYQGVGSLAGPVARAQAAGKGLFVLAATSNREAAATQTATVTRGAADGSTVAASVVREVAALRGDADLGSFGVVIGATVQLRDYGLTDDDLAGVPVLAPGFGEQGAVLSEIRRLFGSATPNVVAASGRSLLLTGPDGLREALVRSSGELGEATR
jgi:orotidine-5'-phosphate decarboxylase